MQVALLSYNAQAGDAIGNQLAEKLAFFLDQGHEARVFLESVQRIHPFIRPHCTTLNAQQPSDDAWQFLTSCDLVLADYGQYYRILGLLPLLVAGKPRLVFDYHGITPPALWGPHNPEAVVRGSRERGRVWCADAALVHSRFARRELLGDTGFPADRTHGLGFPIDTDWFSPGLPVHAFRKKLGLEGARLLLFVGRVAPNKRLPVLVEAIARLRDDAPAVHALVVGERRDVYQAEADRCRELAASLGVADRLHFLGHLDDPRLRDAYRSADVFVMPSRHEGFCIPVVEAMACGLPVVAARAAALPETVGDAGLTFHPDDADDLARQIRRVFRTPPASRRPPAAALRVAVVACRYGTGFVGGAETSLCTIARALHLAGHHVEVFATCGRTESDWSDPVAEGTHPEDGIAVHRFAADPRVAGDYQAASRAIEAGAGDVPAETERFYLANSLRSQRLIECLRPRVHEFDAVVVGPYLLGLTLDVARAFPDKTLLLPCFHDEPAARLRLLREAYEKVGGILYHSREEQGFAEVDLGLNHPGAACIGTVIDTQTAGDADRGRRRVGSGRPYLVYCGRYAPLKGLPTLLDYARRYAARHPDRFTFAFMGQGDVTIPSGPWARDLGFLDVQSRTDVLAGAAALVQMSHNESLSLVALEAWAQGVPVIADRACAVLAGHLDRCQAGCALGSSEAFAAALDDLWENPDAWRERGQRGREYVQSDYGSLQPFTDRIVQAIHFLVEPLAERMRRGGRARAERQFSRARWRARFGGLVKNVLAAPPRAHREQIDVEPCASERTASVGHGMVLVPVRVTNRGTHVAVHDGPARVVLGSSLADGAGRAVAMPTVEAPLPENLLPGKTLSAVVPVPVPAVSGTYLVHFRAERGQGDGKALGTQDSAALRLVVQDDQRPASVEFCQPLREAVETAVVEARRLQQLPDDYLDVTEGAMAGWKRRVKQKLLHNFKHAYVDVLSRQQSRFNQQVLAALHELTQYCATLEHALVTLRPPPATTATGEGPCSRPSGASSREDLASLLHELKRQVLEDRQHRADLEQRLALLESQLVEAEFQAR